MRNGVDHESVELSGAPWTYEFKGLLKYDESGEEYVYSVRELPVDDYESTVTGGSIFNKYTGFTTFDYEVIKKWVGGPSVKPDITIQLIQNGVLFDTVVLEDGEVSHVFGDLPIFDAEGIKYVYEVVELDVEGYESDVVGNEITNTYIEQERELFSISGYKKDRNTGENLQGARIELWREGDSTSYRVAYTDKNGFFKFDGLELGKYTLRRRFLLRVISWIRRILMLNLMVVMLRMLYLEILR